MGFVDPLNSLNSVRMDPTLWTLIELFEFHPDESLELSQLNPDGSMDLFGNYSQRQLLCDRYNYWYLGDNHYIMWNGRFPENTCDDNGKTVSLEAEISTQRCTPFSCIPCELASLRKYFFLFVLFHNMAQSGLQSVHFKLKLFSTTRISSQRRKDEQERHLSDLKQASSQLTPGSNHSCEFHLP